MATNARVPSDSSSESPELDLPGSGAPKTRQKMESSGVPSKHASTTPTTPRLLAVAAPGREDLVVLVNTSAIRMPIISRPASGLDMIMSPANRFVDRDEGTPPDERLCTQLWVLWAALTFPLLLSCWLLFVPFLIGSEEPVVPEVPVYPLPKTPSAPINPLNLTSTAHSTPAISPIAMSTASTTPATARFAWLGIPPRCLLRVVRPSEPSSYTIGPYPTRVAAANRKQRPIFCLFDNDKVTSSRVPQQMSDYMFETLPFALCPNVVYSSVGIVDGYLISRLPHFEQNHGIPRLKQIVQTRGYQDTRILLVLGGYREDAPHFWRLGRDATTLDLLMKNVADGMRNYNLDGVTVHWAAPTSVCSGSDYAMVLSILLRRLNHTFNNYGLTQHIVSVMLDIGIGNEHMVDTVADVVDYFFIGTNALSYQGQGPYQDMCTDLSRNTHQVIANYTRLSRSVRIDQLCIMEELAPWAVLGFEHPGGMWTMLPGSDVNRTRLYTACNDMSLCRKDSGGASCIAHLTYAGPASPAGRTAALFLVPNIDALEQLVNFSGIRSSAQSSNVHACVLVLDLHLDNYAMMCPLFLQYVLMEHFYSGTIGQRRRHQSIIDAAPLCQTPQFG